MLSGKIRLQHKILGFANGTTVNTKMTKSMHPMSDSFFHVHISLAFVTTKMLPQTTKHRSNLVPKTHTPSLTASLQQFV